MQSGALYGVCLGNSRRGMNALSRELCSAAAVAGRIMQGDDVFAHVRACFGGNGWTKNVCG